MYVSPGFVYIKQTTLDLFEYSKKVNTSFVEIQPISDFNIKTKFNKIIDNHCLYYKYSYKKSPTIDLYYIYNLTQTTAWSKKVEGRKIRLIFKFIITYSDEKEFNKFKKENPELLYDTFDDILEIEKDYDNIKDFASDFEDRIKNMVNY